MHSSNDKYSWVPAIVDRKAGDVSYYIKIDLPNNQRIIKAHANHLKLRYIKNEITDLFDVPEWPQSIEPLIVPQEPLTVNHENIETYEEDLANDSDDFQDALDEETIANSQPQEPLRRSERSTKGVPPQRFKC